ncbi:glycine betaine/L-proline ABC transporter ATP-binding protein [bacterium]|nr:glycine betaine/L-proline ABC transporter ATP-binding protein [bacterium]
MTEPIVRLEHVFKIFGSQPRGRALELAKAGVGKNDVQAATGHVVGMSNVNFEVYPGEIFVIMGLSGSGKSTAIRTVNKLHDITYGKVWFEDIDVQSLSGTDLQDFRREKMSMVFQHFALFPHRSVIDNAGYGLKVKGVDKAERDTRSMVALDLVGLGAFAKSYPHELSGGMQQRVGLARALAADTPVMLMDEAFSALDPLIRRQMQDEMMEIQVELKKTIIFITHDLNEALRIGDRVCIMKDGEVVQIGTPEQILTQPATGYVAEFVQDVDQGRVIEVHEVMVDPHPLKLSTTLAEAITHLGDRAGAFVVDDDGKPSHVLTSSDAVRGVVNGLDFQECCDTDFETTTPTATLNTVYAASGRGMPIAVIDDNGKLIGNLDPRHIMEEMGRVENLIDGFEREVFM